MCVYTAFRKITLSQRVQSRQSDHISVSSLKEPPALSAEPSSSLWKLIVSCAPQDGRHFKQSQCCNVQTGLQSLLMFLNALLSFIKVGILIEMKKSVLYSRHQGRAGRHWPPPCSCSCCYSGTVKEKKKSTMSPQVSVISGAAKSPLNL